MKGKMAKKFAFKNLKAHRILYIPFILSSGIMLLLFNIMASLSANEYVRTRHETLPMIINIGIIITGILTFIFFIYSTNFLTKRRNKEFALYGIMGLEKKHIRKIITIEMIIAFFIIAIFALVGGYIFGKLTFLALNKLMKDVAGRIMDYPFSIKAMIETIILLVVAFLASLISTSFKIYTQTPIELLSNQKSGEGEPKSRGFIMILGFILLAAGYFIALTTQGMLTSLLYFFIAALITMLATYLLFMSFSVIYLKRQKKKKSYYKKERFLGVSGLLYRIKSNAISLASISIISVGVIIAVSASLSIYDRIEYSASNVIPREYNLDSKENINKENLEEAIKNLEDKVYKTVPSKENIKNEFVSYRMMAPVEEKENKITSFKGGEKTQQYFVLVYDLEGYNKRVRGDYTLEDDEVLLTANQKFMLKKDKLQIGDKTFKIKIVDNFIPSNLAVESYGIVVKDISTMEYISKELKIYDKKEEKYKDATINLEANWDIDGIDREEYNVNLRKFSEENGLNVEYAESYLKGVYETYGGFVFLGTITAFIFLVATVIISYYKQISEGFEDREKYQIMKKIGLEDKLIKKTSSLQMVYLLFAPLIFAIINSTVASKIIYQLLALFGVIKFMQYGKYLLIVIGVFFVVYYLIFKMTSKAYYKIVSR